MSENVSSQPCCCSAEQQSPRLAGAEDPGLKHAAAGTVETQVGEILRVKTALELTDRLGGWKARWNIGRMNYRVPPGLYAVGNPDSESEVLVTANYKLTFDALRRELTGIDSWILVLETQGINVWCAAGKGTFGTSELVYRVQTTKLTDIVSHRRLIVPQLGAVGVAAHEVKAQCGFTVRYGPVRAADLPAYFRAGRKATPAMRRVTFTIRERAVLVPVELVAGMKYALMIGAILLLAAGLGSDGYALARVGAGGLASLGLSVGAFVTASVFVPLLLPWLPGRAFALKGVWVGIAYFGVCAAFGRGCPEMGAGWLPLLAWGLIAVAVCSFVAMNFTGASTYPSLSGVRKEMRAYVPFQLAATVLGLAAWGTARFVGW